MDGFLESVADNTAEKLAGLIAQVRQTVGLVAD